ncbi:MAG: hypothetical protein HXS46_07775 [Theionarchaea archaeon]|nr:hypothetical protein [Theionarchaea archaeon]
MKEEDLESAIKVTTQRMMEILKDIGNLPDEEISGEARTTIATEATKKMLKAIEKSSPEKTVKHWGPIYGHDSILISIKKRCAPSVRNNQDSTMDVHASIVRIDGEQTVRVLSPGERLSEVVSTLDYVWATVTGLGASSEFAFGTVEF